MNRRRRIIVNEPMQRRLVVTSMWVPCLCLMVLSLLLTVYCKKLHDEAVAQDVELGSLIPLFVVSVGFVAFGALFTVLHGIRLSHKIAGPLVNFDRTTQAFMGGDRSARVKLRENDLLEEVADQVNVLLEWTAQQLEESSEPERTAPESNEAEPVAVASGDAPGGDERL